MASTTTRDLPEEFLAATRKSQEAMIRAIRTWVETVRTITPKLPSAYAPLAGRFPKLPSVTASFADRLPKPEDVVASGYDFAEHLLAVQRKFAEDLLTATEPLIPGNARRVWEDATKRDAAEKTVTAAKAVVAETARATGQAVTGTARAAGQAVAEAAPKPAAPKLRVAESAPKPPVAESAPKPPVAKSAPKPATARKAPAAKPAAPKAAAPRRAPKSTGTR
jgi:hypothetical protein